MAIEVDAPTALADRPVHLRVSGLGPNAQVVLSASAEDYRGGRWRSEARFRTDSGGAVDVDHATPLDGSTYRRADGMGLFWSMNPPDLTVDQESFYPPLPDALPSYTVTVTASVDGKELASRTLTRQWTTDGVTTKPLTPAADGVSGRLYLPPAGGPAAAPVLLFGGSEGGNGMQWTAALLAAHGHPALSLAYFGAPGLPAALQDIPLEYFASAARLLAGQPGADPAKLWAVGYSRGSEAALLLAEEHPELVRNVLVYAPSAQVNPGLAGGVAWTLGGRPVPAGPIPLDRVAGGIIAVAGTDDRVWQSAGWARQITVPAPDGARRTALLYDGAGHGVGTVPFQPTALHATSPSTGRPMDFGGTRPGDEDAQLGSWLALTGALDRP